MARPISNVTDMQIRDCIDQLNADGIKLTISAVTSKLHVRRDRVQPILFKWRIENYENIKSKNEVEKLKQEIKRLKLKLMDREVDNNFSVLKETKDGKIKETDEFVELFELDRQKKLELTRRLIKDLNLTYGISAFEILGIEKNEFNMHHK